MDTRTPLSRARWSHVVVAAVVAAWLFGVGSAAASVGPLVVTVPGVVEQLAADGPRVAVDVTAAQRPGMPCSPVYVWDTASGQMQGYGTCSGCCASEWISQIALAGDEVAWVDVNVAESVERVVFRAMPGGKATFDDLAEAPAGGGGEPGGDYVGHLHGGGSLLIFNAWKQCYPNTGDNADLGISPSEVCGKDKPLNTAVRLKRLVRAGKESTTIARGVGVMPVLSVNVGRIVVRGPDDQLTILRSDGSVLRRVNVQDTVVRGAALDGSQLAVLEPDRLEVDDASSSERRKSFPLSALPAPQRTLAGVGGGYVALVERTSIRVIRISDGKSTTLDFPHALGPVRAQLVPAGLYYSYNDRQAPQTGHLAFLPRASLAARF